MSHPPINEIVLRNTGCYATTDSAAARIIWVSEGFLSRLADGIRLMKRRAEETTRDLKDHPARARNKVSSIESAGVGSNGQTRSRSVPKPLFRPVLSDVFSDALCQTGFARNAGTVTSWGENSDPPGAEIARTITKHAENPGPRPVQGQRRKTATLVCGSRARWRWKSSTPPRRHRAARTTAYSVEAPVATAALRQSAAVRRRKPACGLAPPDPETPVAKRGDPAPRVPTWDDEKVCAPALARLGDER